jgi:hypothetical protein
MRRQKLFDHSPKGRDMPNQVNENGYIWTKLFKSSSTQEAQQSPTSISHKGRSLSHGRAKPLVKLLKKIWKVLSGPSRTTQKVSISSTSVSNSKRALRAENGDVKTNNVTGKMALRRMAEQLGFVKPPAPARTIVSTPIPVTAQEALQANEVHTPATPETNRLQPSTSAEIVQPSHKGPEAVKGGQAAIDARAARAKLAPAPAPKVSEAEQLNARWKKLESDPQLAAIFNQAENARQAGRSAG